MTTLDKIKLIDRYLHGVDRDIRKDEGDFEKEAYYACKSKYGENVHYHTSLDALRPVIVKLTSEKLTGKDFMMKIENIKLEFWHYLEGFENDISELFDSVVECIKYLEEKKKKTENV